MAKETYIRLRCTEEFKAKIETLAKKENRTVSNYIENLLKKEIIKMGKRERLNKLEIVNGFYFLKGNYVDDIEGNNDSNAVGLHWINCDIEDYDKGGVYFDVDDNMTAEIYIQEFDGQREYLLDFKE